MFYSFSGPCVIWIQNQNLIWIFHIYWIATRKTTMIMAKTTKILNICFVVDIYHLAEDPIQFVHAHCHNCCLTDTWNSGHAIYFQLIFGHAKVVIWISLFTAHLDPFEFKGCLLVDTSFCPWKGRKYNFVYLALWWKYCYLSLSLSRYSSFDTDFKFWLYFHFLGWLI